MMSATSPSLAISLTKALKFLTFVQYLGCEQTELLVKAYIYHYPRFWDRGDVTNLRGGPFCHLSIKQPMTKVPPI